MMSDLYNVVKDTINASNMEEASQILYGNGGIVLNSPEYYKEVIARFVRKKDSLIKKNDGRLIFDLKKCNDLYNLIFIAEYIKNELRKQIEQIQKSLVEIQKDLNKITESMTKRQDEICSQYRDDIHYKDAIQHDEQFLKIKSKKVDCEGTRRRLVEIQETLKKLCEMQDVLQVESDSPERMAQLEERLLRVDLLYNDLPLNSSCLDGNLNICIKYVKQAMIINHNLRNSFSHGSSLEDKKTMIEYDTGERESFLFEIPIEYIDGFNKGRIIANDEDQVLVDKTNRLIEPLLQYLNYDLSNLGSLFYNISPEVLSMFLDMFNSDIEKVMKLPLVAFACPKNTIKLNEMGIDVLDPYIPKGAFFDPEQYLTQVKYDISNPTEKEKLDGILVSKAVVSKNPVKIEKYRFLERNGIHVSPDLPQWILDHSEKAVDLKKDGFDVEHFDVPGWWYYFYHNRGIKLSPSFENNEGCLTQNYDISTIISYLNRYGIIITNPDDLPLEFFWFPKNTVRLKTNGIDITDPNLPFEAFKYPETAILLKIRGKNINSPFAYYPRETVMLQTAGVDITNSNLSLEMIKHPENTIYLIKWFHYQYEKLQELPAEFFTCDCSLLCEMLQTYNMNMAKSIFGVNNPKIIAAMVYANSVMRHYQKEIDDGDCVDFDPRKFIDFNLSDSYSYRNNYCQLVNDPYGFKFDKAKYIGQFFGNPRSIKSLDKLKKFILDKIRNSAAHFRIRPVEDASGNVVEDKICIYDKPDELSDPNFFVVMDLQEYVEMIHGIEQDLQFRQPVVTTSNSNSTGGVTR